MAYDKLVLLDDAGRIITARAADIVSGGDLLGFASGLDVVGSVQGNFAWNDLFVLPGSTLATQCVGIALQSAASGTEVPVLMQGTVVLPAGSAAVSGGMPVMSAGYGNMVIGVVGSNAGMVYRGIGRALTGATALTGFAIVRFSI